jgi:hypothetical protein
MARSGAETATTAVGGGRSDSAATTAGAAERGADERDPAGAAVPERRRRADQIPVDAPLPLARGRARGAAEAAEVDEEEVAGKSVAVVSGPLPSRRAYLYAHDDVIFAAGSDHVTRRELRELMSKLP